jgi:hypothetical protein
MRGNFIENELPYLEPAAAAALEAAQGRALLDAPRRRKGSAPGGACK